MSQKYDCYLGHPLRSNPVENKKKANKIAQDLNGQGIKFFSPLHAFSDVDPAGDQREVMVNCYQMLNQCKELWVYGDPKEIVNSTGLQAEIAHADAVGIPVVLKQCEWSNLLEMYLAE